MVKSNIKKGVNLINHNALRIGYNIHDFVVRFFLLFDCELLSVHKATPEICNTAIAHLQCLSNFLEVILYVCICL